MRESREPPVGARRSEADSELAFELLTESNYQEKQVGSDGSPAVEGERHVCAGECMVSGP